MKKIINVETGEVIERELNAEEIAQQEIDEAHILAAKIKAEAKIEEQITAKAALLERLGISADEAAVLFS